MHLWFHARPTEKSLTVSNVNKGYRELNPTLCNYFRKGCLFLTLHLSRGLSGKDSCLWRNLTRFKCNNARRQL